MLTARVVDLLRCPVTKQRLHIEPCSPGRWFAMITAGATRPIGPTDELLVTDDAANAYPVVAGIPVLLEPERLSTHPGQWTGVDVMTPPYAEAYAERSLYSDLAVHSVDGPMLQRLQKRFARLQPESFSERPELWHDGGSTANAKTQAFRHLGPVDGRTVLQVGGIGLHALTLVHAAAQRAVVVSPVIEELVQGSRLADSLGVRDRVLFVGGIAERLPLADGTIDRIFSGSSMHHTMTEESFPESARVLAADGRFASIDVWRAGRAYDLGIRLFGKRHGNVHCRAFDPVRLAPALHSFATVDVTFHGAIARYGLAIGERFGRQLAPERAQRVTVWEDRLADRMPRVASGLSSLVLVRGQM